MRRETKLVSLRSQHSWRKRAATHPMPTDWELQYQNGETPWDKGAPSPALAEALESHRIEGSVLVPGCGTGHDVRLLAGHGAEVLGLDVAPSAIAAAEARPRAAGERYLVGDFFDLPESMAQIFDWIWEHTCFCAIDPMRRPDYVRAAHRALRPGGRLLAVFYLDPGNKHPGEGPPFETSLAEIDHLFSPHFALEMEWLPRRTYAGREGREWMRIFTRNG
jgi:SAM-dependent methyltransferase